MIDRQFWILYDEIDFPKNKAFAELIASEGERRGLRPQTVLTSRLTLTLEGGALGLRIDGESVPKPDFVINRCRDLITLKHLEAMGVPVFNPASVAEGCNDKRRTHQLLSGYGVPMLDTVFLREGCAIPSGTCFPVVIKPACSHGGDRVRLVGSESEWHEAVNAIWPAPAIQQRPVGDMGRDKRVYVVFGQLVAAVERTATDGFLANFSQGGSVQLADITPVEHVICNTVLRALPLTFAGIDFLYDQGRPVVGEVEDVVGCRMLYKTSDINIVGLFLDELISRL